MAQENTLKALEQNLLEDLEKVLTTGAEVVQEIAQENAQEILEQNLRKKLQQVLATGEEDPTNCMILNMQYKGYTIAVEHDNCAENPLLDWDNCAILYDAVYKYTYMNNECILNHVELPELDKEAAKVLIDHLMSCDNYDNLKIWLTDNYFSTRDYYSITDWLNDHINDRLGRDGEDIPALIAAICDAKGCNSYISGECICYSLEDLHAKLGLTPDTPTEDILEGIIDVYSSWKDGETYTLTVINGEGEDDYIISGFYGPNHTTNGLLEHAVNHIDCI